jgi:hypothetical protein
MTVAEVIRRAENWVGKHAVGETGFTGAHLLGSVNALPLEAEFKPFLDVDIAVVLKDVPAQTGLSLPYRGLLRENRELSHDGLIIEAVYMSGEIYQSAEDVLSNPTLAYDMRVGRILSDPRGELDRIHRRVAAEFSRPVWVRARCEEEKLIALGSLKAGESAATPGETAFSMSWGATCLCSLLALATLEPATHRRSLVRAKRILGEKGRPELHERLLNVLGFDRLDEHAVRAYLDHFARVFDRAVEVTTGQTPFSFKLSPHVRPYLIEGSREMVDEGHHREALFWIFSGIFVSTLAVLVEGDPSEAPEIQAAWEGLLNDLGLADGATSRLRLQEEMALAQEYFALADALIDGG